MLLAHHVHVFPRARQEAPITNSTALLPGKCTTEGGAALRCVRFPRAGDLRGSKKLACPETSLQIGPLKSWRHFFGSGTYLQTSLLKPNVSPGSHMCTCSALSPDDSD